MTWAITPAAVLREWLALFDLFNGGYRLTLSPERVG